MRALAILLLLGGVVRAEPVTPDPLVAGQALATERRFKEAIAKFKDAHKLDSTRSEPDCLISLSYRRLERWGQAKLFLTRCLTYEQRPDWVAVLVTDIEAGIQQAALTPVRFVIQPEATVTVASFAPDESFAPQTIYLELGAQLFTIQAAGFTTQKLTIELTSPTPRDVTVTLEPTARAPVLPEKSTPTPRPTDPPRATASATLTGGRVLAVSGGVLALGITTHVLTAITRSDAEQTGAAYDSLIGRFRIERAVTVSAYSIAAIGTGIGLWIVMHASKEQHVARAHVVPEVSPGGASIAWISAW